MIKFLKIFLSFVILFSVMAVVFDTDEMWSVFVGGKRYTVEVVNSKWEMVQGLSGRNSLSDSEGMLFAFDKPGKYGFWMKNMQFPIDIIWISENLTIIWIEKSVSPDTYPKSFVPESPAKYVLEISAGQVESNNIKIGDFIQFSKNKF